MLKGSCFTFVAMVVFGLIGMSDVKADPTSTWDGVYFGVGGGAGLLSGLSVDARRSKDLMERDCNEGISADGVCLDPDDEWWKIADWWFDDRFSNGEDEDYSYSKNINDINDDWQIFGTVQVGVDKQVGEKIVIGAFADYDFYADSDGSFAMPWNMRQRDWALIGSLSGNVELEKVWSVGGRIGALLTPQMLLYGMGGYTQASLDGNVVMVAGDSRGVDTLSVSFPDELRGYFVGVGGEYKFENNMSLKVEYRYSKFDGDSASVSNNFVTYDLHDVSSGWEHKSTFDRDLGIGIEPELHAVRAVLVYRFGDNDEALQPLK